ncbi:hypothetical protein R80B4_02595 [Fibrobacteres bacterium R8-0-B4]
MIPLIFLLSILLIPSLLIFLLLILLFTLLPLIPLFLTALCSIFVYLSATCIDASSLISFGGTENSFSSAVDCRYSVLSIHPYIAQRPRINCARERAAAKPLGVNKFILPGALGIDAKRALSAKLRSCTGFLKYRREAHEAPAILFP